MLQRILKEFCLLGRQCDPPTEQIDERPTIRVALFNDTRAAGHYGCDLVMQELIRLLQEHRMQPFWFHPVGIDWREAREAIPRSPQIDAVIVNGEGSIHHSQTRPRAVYLAEVATMCREVLRVPCFLINSTIQHIHEPVVDHLRRFDRIYVRERRSKRELARFGVDADVAPDLTVLADLPRPQQRRGVCGTDSVLAEATRGIRSLCRDRGWPFRSMVWKHKKPGSLPVTPGGRDGIDDFARFLVSHELVVTGRFHTVMFCLATATPFVAIESNTDKISAVVEDAIGNQDRMLNIESLQSFDPTSVASWSETELKAIQRYVRQAPGAVEAMFSEIRECVLQYHRSRSGSKR